MTINTYVRVIALTLVSLALTASPASAHKLREKGAETDVADSNVVVTPARNWNRLDVKVGKRTETWTLDGEQLNDVTFFGGIEPGAPLVREKSKKRDPLPKFTKSTLLIEIPELLEGILGSAAASGASNYWQYGNCVKIDAKPPYRPKPGATTEIPVAVVHKQDGSSVPARVDATLDGGKSLSPVVIRRAPGSLTHVAPDKAGVSMSIVLQARSRRGSARERYDFATVDPCYDIEGGGGEFKGSGSTCDLTQPFTVEGNANIVVEFTPTDAKGGSYSYTGNISGAKLSGKGTYTVQYNGEVPVGIKGSGPGTACTPMGCFTSPGTEKYTLTPQ